MWSSLPSNLRTVLGTALLLGIGVAAAAFTLSFFALRDAAANPALRWGQGHAWLFPIGVDMALVFFEVLLLGASMVRVEERGKVVQYPRAIPFLLVLVAAAGTLYFNATHVPEQVRPIALAVPVASILVTLGLAYLLKMLAAASGVEAIHLAPPALGPSRIVRNADVLHGELVRDTEVPGLHGPGGAWGQISSTTQQQAPQVSENGHGELPEATKRQQVEAYLASLDARQLATTTRSQVAAELTARGMPVDETYAGRILGEWRVNHPAASGAGKRGSRGR
jgi:Protein of unknown function (DUF2637)